VEREEGDHVSSGTAPGGHNGWEHPVPEPALDGIQRSRVHSSSNAVMAIIETPRLVLRPPIGSDIEPMMVIHQDPDVMKYLDSRVSGDIATAWRNVAMMIGHWSISGFGPWIVVMKESSQIIGRAGLWYPAGAADVELGWMIRRSDWGRGFATEAASAALKWAWQHVDTDHIVSLISAANTPSIRIAEKLGQRLESTRVVDGAALHTFGIYRSVRNTV
jgi:RimJ/RimL family protein N-acetyltransferase